MEGLQGAVLEAKLKHLPSWIARRQTNANLYRKHLSNARRIVLPDEAEERTHTFHLFVIRARERDKIAAFLKERQIYTGIHYPIPCHLQKAYSFLDYSKGDFPIAEKCAEEILSLPMFPELTEDEIIFVSDSINEFYYNT